MVKRNFIRLLAAVLIIAVLSPCAFADAGERLAVEREVYDFLTEELMLSNAAATAGSQESPAFAEWGTRYKLYWLPDDELAEMRALWEAQNGGS